jgi:hypothetical protein
MLVTVSASWAATYYVDSKVSSNGNGSQNSPWKKISDLSGVREGDFILFKRGAFWNETLSPTSGAEGIVVTYRAYGRGAKHIIRNFNADGKAYIKVQDIEFKSTNSSPAVRLYRSHHITLENCSIYADQLSTTWAALYILMDSYRNEIIGCDIEHRNLARQTDAINLRDNADYNLILNNTIGIATHYSLTLEGGKNLSTRTANYNVIKGNTINNPQGAMIELQSNSNNNLLEGNIVSGGKSTSYCANLPRSLKVVTRNNIIRKNIFFDNFATTGSGIGLDVYDGAMPNNAVGNMIYNNIIKDHANRPFSFGHNGDAGCEINDNYFKNNIVYGNVTSKLVHIGGHPNIKDIYFSNNIFYATDVTRVLYVKGKWYSVKELDSSDLTHFMNNIDQDPALDSDFHPRSDSPGIDKGSFLTTTTNAGRGNIIPVQDARYFMNGWGLIDGDLIQLEGQTQTARIKNINYTTNTITVDTPLYWNNGQGISLAYQGFAPDVGAYENESEDKGKIPPAPDKMAPAAPLGLRVISSN